MQSMGQSCPRVLSRSLPMQNNIGRIRAFDPSSQNAFYPPRMAQSQRAMQIGDSLGSILLVGRGGGFCASAVGYGPLQKAREFSLGILHNVR